jgi:hypothetical protein
MPCANSRSFAPSRVRRRPFGSARTNRALTLELVEVPPDRRLSESQRACRPAQAAGLGDGEEGPRSSHCPAPSLAGARRPRGGAPNSERGERRRAGHVCVLPAQRPHAWKSTGRETDRVLFLYTAAAAGGYLEEVLKRPAGSRGRGSGGTARSVPQPNLEPQARIGHSAAWRSARFIWWAVKDSNLGPAD